MKSEKICSERQLDHNFLLLRNATDFAKIAGIENRVTANGILSQLWKGGLIRKVREGSGRTPAVYALAELINITEGRTVMPEIVVERSA